MSNRGGDFINQFIVNSKDLKGNRFDENFWNPKYKNITSLATKASESSTCMLKEISNIEIGKAGKRYYIQDKEVRYLTIRDYDNYVISNKYEKYIKKDGFNDYKKSRVEQYDIFFSISGTLGKVFLVDEIIEDTNVCQDICLIRFMNKDLSYIMYFYLQSEFVKNQIERYKNGTGILHINKQYMNSIVVPEFNKEFIDLYKSYYLEMMDLYKEKGEQIADSFRVRIVNSFKY